MGHRMLPRTTQQSHSAAPRREPQIEPWLAMLPPSCLSAPRPRPNQRQVRTRKCVMTRTSRSKPCRSGQQGLDAKKNKTSLRRVKCFYLTSPFIEPASSQLSQNQTLGFPEALLSPAGKVALRKMEGFLETAGVSQRAIKLLLIPDVRKSSATASRARAPAPHKSAPRAK